MVKPRSPAGATTCSPGRSLHLAALHTRDEPLRPLRAQGGLRCGREARPKSPLPTPTGRTGEAGARRGTTQVMSSYAEARPCLGMRRRTHCRPPNKAYYRAGRCVAPGIAYRHTYPDDRAYGVRSFVCFMFANEAERQTEDRETQRGKKRKNDHLSKSE